MIPTYSGDVYLRSVSITNILDKDGEVITYSYLVSHGVTNITLRFQVSNSSQVVFGSWKVTGWVLGSPASSSVILYSVGDWLPSTASNESKYQALNGVFSFDIDPATTATKLTLKNIQPSQPMTIARYVGDASLSAVTGFAFSLTVIGVSEKSVLDIYAHPLYAAMTSAISTLYAALRRIQQYAASAFSGLGLATVFSGLTGSAIAAMVLGLVFFVIFVELYKKR